MAADVQREARALGDPTRHRLFRYIADAPAPVGVAELTADIQLNHNAVRQHLAVLKEAGLVTEDTENRDRPGRPGLLYHLHPEAARSRGTHGAGIPRGQSRGPSAPASWHPAGAAACAPR
jgi:DNA-binding transcriptional ArsR family regulator